MKMINGWYFDISLVKKLSIDFYIKDNSGTDFIGFYLSASYFFNFFNHNSKKIVNVSK